MDKRESRNTIAESPQPYSNLSLKELEEFCRWIAKHWTVGGAAMFCLAALYFHQFTATENVPLSLNSGAAIASLPLMLALVAFAFLMLLLLILLPVAVLFTRKRRGDPVHFLSLTGDAGYLGDPALRKKWAGMMFVLSCSWGTALIASSHFEFPATAGALVPLIIGLLFGLVVLVGPIDARWKDIRFEYVLVASLSAVVQYVVVFFCFYPAARLAQDQSNEVLAYAMMFTAFLFITMLLGVFQLFSTELILRTAGQENRLKKAALGALGLLLIGAMLPPVGGKLAGYAFGMTASGGRSCTQLGIAEDALKSIHPSVLNGRSITHPLKILAEADGRYFVRRFDLSGEDVMVVPSSAVLQFSSCQD